LTVAALLLFGCVALNETENQAEVHFMLGVSHLRANDPTQALQEFLQAEEIEPDDAQLQAGLAQAYFLKRSYQEAERHFLKALDLDKNNPKYQNNLAALYLETERWNDAIAYFEKAGSNLLFPHPEVAWTGYGYAWFRKGDPMKAIDAFIKALEFNPRYAQTYVRRGEVFYDLGQPGKAAAEYRKALAISPDYLLAHYNLAITNMKLRQVDSAIEHFDRVVALAPDTELARQSKAYLLVLK